MTTHYPIVLEHEPNGTISAFVVGLPGVYAAADTERAVVSAIRSALQAHLGALHTLGVAERASRSSVRVAKVTFSGASAWLDPCRAPSALRADVRRDDDAFGEAG